MYLVSIHQKLQILTFFWYILETVSLYLVSIDQVLGDVDLEFADSDLYLVSIEEELVNIYLQMINTNQLLAYIWSVMTMT